MAVRLRTLSPLTNSHTPTKTSLDPSFRPTSHSSLVSIWSLSFVTRDATPSGPHINYTDITLARTCDIGRDRIEFRADVFNNGNLIADA